jgi:HK97 family phage major capsid protein
MPNENILDIIIKDKDTIKKDGLLSTVGAAAGVNIPLEVKQDFISQLVLSPTLLSVVRTEVLNGPNFRIPKILFDDWVLYAKTENTAPTSGQYSTSSFGYVDLSPKDISAATFITHEAMRDINGGSALLIQKHEDLFYKKLSANILSNLLLADTAFVDGNANKQAVMRKFDGWIKQAANNPVTAQVNPAGLVTLNAAFDISDPVIEKVLEAMLTSLASEYFSASEDMAFIMSAKNLLRLRSALGKRLTPLGDTYHNGRAPVALNGIPVIGDEFIPEGVIILTNPKNMIFAPHTESMRFLTDYDKYLDRQNLFVHANYGLGWEELKGVVYQTLS